MFSCVACSETFDLILVSVAARDQAAAGDDSRICYTIEFRR